MLVAIILTRCLTGGPNVKPTVELIMVYKHHITLSPTTMGTCVFAVFSKLLLVFWYCCCFLFKQVYCYFVVCNSVVLWFCCCFNFNRVCIAVFWMQLCNVLLFLLDCCFVTRFHCFYFHFLPHYHLGHNC